MSTLNKPLCATSYGNTGFGNCFLEPKKIVGGFDVPASFSISQADLATLQVKFNTARHAAIGARIFPYHNFTAINDQTEEVNMITTDYGAKYKNRDGWYDLTFRYMQGGVMVHQEMQKNEGAGKRFILYDEDNTLFGYRFNGSLTGIPVEQFLPLPWRFATGSDKAQYLLRFIFDPKYINKGNLAYVKLTDFNAFDIAGLEDVTLSLDSLAASVATVLASSKISDINLYSAFSANLAQVTAWVLTNKQTGAVSALTTAAVNATKGGWDLTIPTAAWSAAASGDKFSIRLAAPSVLSAAPISLSGYESRDELIITKP